MEKPEDALSAETTSDLVQVVTDEKDGEEFALEYYKAQFLASIGRSLYYARRQAGLTQAQIAKRMNTTQSAVARFEADKNGAMSFHRYLDFAIACDMMPRSLVLHPILEPIAVLRDKLITRAKSGWREEYSHAWNSAQVLTVENSPAQLVSNSALSSGPTPLTNRDVKAAIETAENIVRQPQLAYPGGNVITTSSGYQTCTMDQSAINNKKAVLA